MLILLDDDFLSGGTFSEMELGCIENVLSSIFNGEHALRASRRLLKFLQDFELGIRAKAVLRKAIGSYATEAGKYARVPPRLRIRRSIHELRMTDELYEIPLAHFNQFQLARILLCAENLVDVEILKYAAKHYVVRERLASSFSINAEPKGCGGSQLPTEVETAIENFRFVVSISDSDKVFPNATSSSTTNKCRRLESSSDFPYKHIELPARDIENLFPLNLIILFADPAVKDVLLFFAANQSVWLTIRDHIDIKDGLKIHKLMRSDVYRSQGCREFWESTFSTLCSLDAPSFLSEGCDENHGTGCNCFIFPSLGDSLSTRVLEYLKNNSDHHSFQEFYTDERWMGIGEELFSWLVCERRIRE